MNLIRVLHVITGISNRGGAENYVMNMYRNIDRTKVQFDFLLRSRETAYEEEIKKLGGRIFYTSEYPRHFIKNKKEVEAFFESHKDYDIVHVHANALIYMTVLKIAKKHNINCRIMHSHNTDTKRPIYRIIHNFNKQFINKWATDYFACSTEAGKWMFKNDFILRKNAINIDKFQKDKEVRKKIRKDLGVEDKFVIGHIGRFVIQKNHTFLLKIFNEYHKKNPESVLLLVGDGYLEEDIKNLVNEYGLKDSVKFLGNRSDVDTVFQAFDIMVFPSLFEGLPVVIVEAQAANVPCIISDNITDEVLITSSVKKLSLDEEVETWIKNINQFKNYDKPSEEEIMKKFILVGFDSKSAAKELQSFYLNKAYHKVKN